MAHITVDVDYTGLYGSHDKWGLDADVTAADVIAEMKESRDIWEAIRDWDLLTNPTIHVVVRGDDGKSTYAEWSE